MIIVLGLFHAVRGLGIHQKLYDQILRMLCTTEFTYGTGHRMPDDVFIDKMTTALP